MLKGKFGAFRRKSRQSLFVSSTSSLDIPSDAKSAISTPATSNGSDHGVPPAAVILQNGQIGHNGPPPSIQLSPVHDEQTDRFLPNSRPVSMMSKRESLYGSPSGSASPRTSSNGQSGAAPQILSITEGTWVHTSLLLVFGQCGTLEKPLDGTVTVNHHQDSFPATVWPCSDGYFKALVHLDSGPNKIRFEFNGAKNPPASSYLTIHMMPVTSAPPLHLVILVGSDSPCIYDCPPEKARREGHNLLRAEQKFRMAAYLWQAFTSEQMHRNRLGRRSFRLEEEWSKQSLSSNDDQPRNIAKIHIVRSDKTTAEIQDLDCAQQNANGKRTGDLYTYAMDAVTKYFDPKNEADRRYVAVLILDSTWDPEANMIRGHAALGGGNSLIQMGIFGSHSLHSWPSSIEEVVAAFTDCTKTDTSFVANDCNESGSNWEAACIGIGAMMHEVGHAFGCPHQADGIMLRGYVTLNRSFIVKESYSTRTKSQGLRICYPKDECFWHRLDLLRFRYHPCFRSPGDTPTSSIQEQPQIYGVANGLMVTSQTGLAFVELVVNGTVTSHIEVYPRIEKQYLITEDDIFSRLHDVKRTQSVKLNIHTIGQGSTSVEDFAKAVAPMSKVSSVDGKLFKSPPLGLSQMDGSKPSSVYWKSGRIITSLRFYHGNYLDGVEFFYDDSTSDIFGNRSGETGDFSLDTRRGEAILGFSLKAGFWIDSIQVLTSTGRKSAKYGNAAGGSAHVLIPPIGYSLRGVSGSAGPWVDGFSILYS